MKNYCAIGCLCCIAALSTCKPIPAGPSDSSPTASSVCGNDKREKKEICDGTDLDEQSCTSLGFGPGQLSCNARCDDFDRSACGASAACGDNVKESVELCDGTDLGDATCESLGYGGGALACLENCAGFDLSSCGVPASCGNGQREGIELCDADDFDGLTCVRLGFDGGQLSCASDCLSINIDLCTRACTPTSCEALGAVCGDQDLGCETIANCGTCDEDHHCVDGTCAIGDCEINADCTYGRLCNNHYCQPGLDTKTCRDCSCPTPGLPCEAHLNCEDGEHTCLINAFYSPDNPHSQPENYCAKKCDSDEDCVSGFECNDIFMVVSTCQEGQTCSNGQQCRVGDNATVGYCPCTTDAECMGTSSGCDENGLCFSHRACGLVNGLFCIDVGVRP